MAVVKGSKRIRPPIPTFTIDEIRWEFLRRNKTYQKEYDKICALDGDEWNDPIDALLAKWAINEPLDWRMPLPSNSYFDLSLPRTVLLSDRNPNSNKAKIYLNDAFAKVNSGTRHNPRRFLMLLFDLNEGLPSKDDLWTRVQKYRSMSRHRPSKSKRTLAELNRLIWILKMTEAGLTVLELARILYPKSDNPTDRRSDVKDQIKTAKAYIELAPFLPIHS